MKRPANLELGAAAGICGVVVPQVSNATVMFNALQAADRGSFRVVVHIQSGRTSSDFAVLAVNQATVDLAFNPGAHVELNVLALPTDGSIVVGGSFQRLIWRRRSASSMRSTTSSDFTTVTASLAAGMQGFYRVRLNQRHFDGGEGR